MARFLKRRLKARGQDPDSLVLIGKQKMDRPQIHVMQYGVDHLLEKNVDSIAEAAEYVNTSHVTWMNIYGIHDVNLMQDVRDRLELPPLLMENILNTDLRPKYEDGEGYDAFILKMLNLTEGGDEIDSEQITLILGEHFVLTLQERKGDVFEPLRYRIRNNKGRIREMGNDYLAYDLMDTVVDNYTLLIENIGRKVEDLEDKIFQNKDDTIAEEIYNFKTELNFLRKSVRPVKDLMIHLLKSENSNFQEANKKFLVDLNELVIQSTDAIELYNNLLSDQLNYYNTTVSNRMNEVMKMLTLYASIFIPLTFIAGVYGMNFDYIPELQYRYAYPIFWLVVGLVGGGILVHFRRKKWL